MVKKKYNQQLDIWICALITAVLSSALTTNHEVKVFCSFSTLIVTVPILCNTASLFHIDNLLSILISSWSGLGKWWSFSQHALGQKEEC